VHLSDDYVPDSREIFSGKLAKFLRTATQEASWRRVFDPYAPLLFNLYHYLEQNLHLGLEIFFAGQVAPEKISQ